MQPLHVHPLKLEESQNMSGLGDMGPGRSKRATCCQVPGCQNSIVVGRAYYRRYRICVQHTREPEVMWGGERSRCQQCARFQPIGDFDSNHRTCRVRLARHNATRHARGERGERARQQAHNHVLAAHMAANMQGSPHSLAGVPTHQLLGAAGSLPLHSGPFLPPSPFEFTGAPGPVLHFPQQALPMLPDGASMMPSNMKSTDVMAIRTTSTGQMILEPLVRDSRTTSLEYSAPRMQQNSPSFTAANGEMVMVMPNQFNLQHQSPQQKASKMMQLAPPGSAGTEGTDTEASWSIVQVEPKTSQDNPQPASHATKLHSLAQQLLAEEQEEEEAAEAKAVAQRPQMYVIREPISGHRPSTPDKPSGKHQGVHAAALLPRKASSGQESSQAGADASTLQQRSSLRLSGVVPGGSMLTDRHGNIAYTLDGSSIKQELVASNGASSSGSAAFTFQQPTAMFAPSRLGNQVCVLPAGASWGVWPNSNGQPIQVLVTDPTTGQTSMQLVELQPGATQDGMQQVEDASQGANVSGSNNQGDTGGAMVLAGQHTAASIGISNSQLAHMSMVAQRTCSPATANHAPPRNSGGSPTEVANNQAASPVRAMYAAAGSNTVYQLLGSMPNSAQGPQGAQQVVYCVQPASYESTQEMEVQQFMTGREPSAESQLQECGTNTGNEKGMWTNETNGSPIVLTAAQSAALMGLIPATGDNSVMTIDTVSAESDYMQGSQLRLLGSQIITPSNSGILAQSLLSPVSSQVLFAGGSTRHGLLAGAQLLQSNTAEAGATWA